MSQTVKRSRGVPVARSIYETAPKAFLIMLFSGLFLLLIITAFISNTVSPVELTALAAPSALIAGCIIGGFFCGKRLRGADSVVGAVLSSAVLTASLLAAKIFITPPDDRLGFIVTLLLHLLTVAVSALSALSASRVPQRRRRKKFKHRS